MLLLSRLTIFVFFPFLPLSSLPLFTHCDYFLLFFPIVPGLVLMFGEVEWPRSPTQWQW